MNETNAGMMTDILQVIANDKNVIPYRPELNVLTGGNVVATILLQQIVYWWFKNGRQKFYKFRDKPKSPHKLYKDGDSWCEELGVSGKVFDTALKKIGYKIGKARNVIPKEEAFVWYYTDDKRVTWYILNEELLCNRLKGIYRIIPKKGNTDIIAQKGIIIIPETTTEITTETTKDISASNDAATDSDLYFNTNPKDNIPLKEIIELYHSICTSFPRVQKITDGRRRAVRSRWLEYGNLDTFRTLFEKARASDFLSGRSGRWTGCNFDWLMKPSNMVKVLEGCYDNKNTPAKRGMAEPTSPDKFAEEQRLIEEVFGGDIREYGHWLSCGKPPLDEWRRKHGNSSGGVHRQAGGEDI